MNSPVSNIFQNDVTILNRPRMTIFSILILVILLYEILWFLIRTISGPPFDFKFWDFGTQLDAYVINDPMIYPLILLSGVSLLFTTDFGFGSRRRFRTAGLLLMLGSVIYPLSQYFSPVSYSILLSLESAGLSPAQITPVFNIILSGIFLLFVAFPIYISGGEIFLQSERKILNLAIVLILLSVILQILFMFIPLSFYESMVQFLGGTAHYNILISTMPAYLEIASLIGFFVAFTRHRILLSREMQNIKTSSP